ncbi:hypothetical protein EMGBS15_13160 [Filimonas sp.]|nr:hypothetical protein EMGBS15_13160 [Filimonas sp.]
MKILIEFLTVAKQPIQFVFDAMMFNTWSQFRMVVSLMLMILDFVLQVVDVDKLDLELVVKMFDTDEYVFVGLARCEWVEFAFHLIDVTSGGVEFIMPFFTF